MVLLLDVVSPARAESAVAPSSDRPNFILIIADDIFAAVPCASGQPLGLTRGCIFP